MEMQKLYLLVPLAPLVGALTICRCGAYAIAGVAIALHRFA
jgi:hypothetical protein